MIPIQRKSEPGALPAIRTTEIARVRRAIAAGEALDRVLLGKKYKAFVEELRAQQLGKCCYCGWRYPHPFNDVEHFRPAVSALRGAGFTTVGYWWLAWTWENLMFSCAPCNRSGKNDAFPLLPGSRQLATFATAPGSEQPSLLDPCSVVDPLRHIRFAIVRYAGKDSWRPFGMTHLGRTTVREIGLDRDVLVQEYDHHVTLHVLPDVDSLRGAMDAGQATQVESEWRRVSRWLAPNASFTALAHDAIVAKIGKTRLRRWRLDPTAELNRRWASYAGLP